MEMRVAKVTTTDVARVGAMLARVEARGVTTTILVVGGGTTGTIISRSSTTSLPSLMQRGPSFPVTTLGNRQTPLVLDSIPTGIGY